MKNQLQAPVGHHEAEDNADVPMIVTLIKAIVHSSVTFRTNVKLSLLPSPFSAVPPSLPIKNKCLEMAV